MKLTSKTDLDVPVSFVYATLADHAAWEREAVQRGATVECANAQLRRRGLHRFNVCGMAKARAVLLWHALAHNLMRMRSLGIALAA